MTELQLVVAAFFIGVVGSFLGSLVGAGGLVSIPLLIFIGLPPQVAIATNKCISVGGGATAMYKFSKAKKVLWKYVPAFIVLALIATFVGTKILLEIPEEFIKHALGGILLLFIPLLFYKKKLGTEQKEVSKNKKMFGYGLYFFGLVYAAMIGAGAGTLIFMVLMYFFGLPIIQANATDLIPWYILTCLSLIIFSFHGIVDYSVGIALLIGGLFGGYLGAKVAIQKGNARVKGIFIAVIAVSAIKLLFF